VCKRPFKDRDYIRTVENFIFCIVGYEHPPDRVFAYLKYVPASDGLWCDSRSCYERKISFYSARDVCATFEFLKQNYPEYIYYCPYNRITFSAVPHSRIENWYLPERELSRIIGLKSRDPLQEKLVRLVKLLSKESGIDESRFGVTGSILLGIHNPRISDIDLVIYGRKESLLLKEVILELEKKRTIRKFYEERWCIEKSKFFGIPLEVAREILRRKWNLGIFEGTRFSVHPVKKDSEITEKYGKKSIIPMGPIEIEASISDTSESMFNPAVYGISEVTVIRGPVVEPIRELVSFEGVFAGILEVNERIRVYGKLERVMPERGVPYYRVVIGSRELSGREHFAIL